MKIIFFASSDFAIPILEAIISKRHEVIAVVTQPDKKAGRHLVLTPPPVKSFCAKNKLLVYQPDNLRERKVYDRLNEFAADLFVVVSYGKIIPKDILTIPKIFSINVHASLLPKYRGASPINYALLGGDGFTGISIIKMNEFMDRGEVIFQKKCSILDTDDAILLSNSLSKMGAVAAIEAINLIKIGKYKLKRQDEKKASYAPKLTKKDGLISWNKNREDIINQVRGLVPWPGTYTYFNKKMLKIYRVEVLDYEQDKMLKPGEILDITEDGIIVFCQDGALIIKELQIESGKKMSAYNFAVGHKIKKGYLLG